MNRIISVYIGHKLTDATKKFEDEMQDTFSFVFGHLPNCKRIPFLGLSWNDPVQVYKSDFIDGIGISDLVVIVLDEQSDGIIAEMYASLYKYGVPTVLLHQGRRKISGLIRGTVAMYPERFLFELYENPHQVVEIIKRAITKFQLDTDHPIRFPCLESYRSNHGSRPDSFPTEAPDILEPGGIQAGYEKSRKLIVG